MTINKTLINVAAATALALGGLSLSLPTVAQDALEAVKQENAEYFSMTFVDYKPGQRRAALEIIQEHFVKAGKASATPGPIAIHFESGKYDAAFYWVLQEGMASLEWVTSPNEVKWWAAMVEQEGSEKKAQKVMDDYQSKVASEYRVVGHRHLGDDAEE